MKRKEKNNLLPLFLIIGLFLFSNQLKGNIKVEPLINYNDFLKWYAETIGDYNSNGSIPFEADYFEYWLKNIKKIN